MSTATADNELYGADAELISMFLDNAQELVDEIDSDLLRLDESLDHADKGMMDRLFRNMHTIKGESGFVSLNNIGRLTHAMEDILDRIRNDELNLSANVLNALIAGVGRLRHLIGAVDASDQEDISADVAALVAILGKQEIAAPEQAVSEPPAPVVEAPQPVSAPKPARPAKSPAEPGSQNETARVLIVDDERMIAKMAERALRKTGIISDAVMTADEAVSAMQRNLYRVVVCDLHLPDMTGDELIPKMKAISPLTQVIMITGDASLGTVLRCLEAGALDFIHKSQDYLELATQVNEALDRAARWKPLMTSRL